jgi:hypothetical protein
MLTFYVLLFTNWHKKVPKCNIYFEEKQFDQARFNLKYWEAKTKKETSIAGEVFCVCHSTRLFSFPISWLCYYLTKLTMFVPDKVDYVRTWQSLFQKHGVALNCFCGVIAFMIWVSIHLGPVAELVIKLIIWLALITF